MSDLASGDGDCDTSMKDYQSTEQHRTVFRGKSTFVPFKGRNASLDTYCRLVESDVTSILKSKRQYKLAHNLSEAQLPELALLKQDSSIVIQSADKGGAVVILNRRDYEVEIQRQLSNSTFYKKLSTNPVINF